MEGLEKVRAMEVARGRTVLDLVKNMADTGFQGRALADACFTMSDMLKEPDLTVLMGYSGSLSTTGQWKLVKWMIENNMVDILVSTGANISEDIVDAMGFSYWKGSAMVDNEKLFKDGYNRYYDVYGKEEDYYQMTELISDFIQTLPPNKIFSSCRFLHKFGLWLSSKGIECIVSAAARKNVPIFCPALVDSPYGDAALLAKSRGVNLCINSVDDYSEFMGLAGKVRTTGVVYVGGGVPKDFIQLFAVSPSLMYSDFTVPSKECGKTREITEEVSYPHKYAIQITTDSPQWGGLSGCTFEEASSWGKEYSGGRNVQCFCDATIALPILVHSLSDMMGGFIRQPKELALLLNR